MRSPYDVDGGAKWPVGAPCLPGGFICTPAGVGAHGPVRVHDAFHFRHADGTHCLPLGTTAYAWTHQGDELEEQTLRTLAHSPFTKLRMCIFPKSYDYNANEPERYPFEGSLETGWDFAQPNPGFWRHLERRIGQLGELGIEADLILFHAYDRWGSRTWGTRRTTATCATPSPGLPRSSTSGGRWPTSTTCCGPSTRPTGTASPA